MSDNQNPQSGDTTNVLLRKLVTATNRLADTSELGGDGGSPQLNAVWSAPAAKIYDLILRVARAGTIQRVTVACGTGTCNIRLAKNGAPLGAALPVTSERVSTTVSLTLAEGDRLAVQVSDLSSVEDLTLTLDYV